MNNQITFGTLHKDGTVGSVRIIQQSVIGNCPFYILLPEHYWADGTCKCSDATHRAKMIKEWGYKRSDFKNIPLKEA